MTTFEWLLVTLAAAASLVVAAFKTYYLPPEGPEIDEIETEPEKPVVATPSAPQTLLWDTPAHAYHSTRVICDEMGLTYTQKNTLCACVYQESRFKNSAIGKNKYSTDWGLVQVNDTPGWHIGPGLRFKSVQDVLDNPEKAVRWMVSVLKGTGKLQPWASYTSGAYKQWLVDNSPMWKLKQV